MLARNDGSEWTRYYWRDLFQEVRKTAKLDDDIVPYTLRHVAITEMVVSGIDLLSVARLAGTSVTMIQKHYGHLMKEKIAAQLPNVKML